MAQTVRPCRRQWLLDRGEQWSGRPQPLLSWAKCWMLAGGCCRLIAKPSTSHLPFQLPPDKDPLGRSLLACSFFGAFLAVVNGRLSALQGLRHRKRGRNYCLLLLWKFCFNGPCKSFVPDDHGSKCSFCQSRRTIPLFLQNSLVRWVGRMVPPLFLPSCQCIPKSGTLADVHRLVHLRTNW